MKISTGKGFGGLVDKAMSYVTKDVGLERALNDCELAVGFDNDNGFGIPSHAADSALFCGDEAVIGNKICDAATEAMLRADATKVSVRPRWNEATQKFDMEFKTMGGDAAPDFLAGQVFSPWNITYLNKIWKEPLSYSHAKELVRSENAGNNPFAELFTLFLEQYAGWGVIGQTGTFQNNMTNDVQVKNGMASFPIINMMGTYTLTLREKKQKNWGPMGTSPLARKQSYLEYVMDMIKNILIIYGNEETNTPGLMQINPIKTWESGKSVKDLYASTTSTTRGSDLFRMLANVVNDFMARADNKFGKIKIAVSPEAYNYLLSTPYSDVYSPQAALKTFADNYLAGKGPGHTTPTIEWVAEPLLKPNSEVNKNPFDYMILSAPEIGGGPENERQATNFYANVLDKFVFPVIPGMYNEQYKTLSRTAGVIAPIPAATEVYAGFGVQG